MEGFCLGMMRVPRGCGMIGSVSSWDKSTHRHTFDPYLETNGEIQMQTRHDHKDHIYCRRVPLAEIRATNGPAERLGSLYLPYKSTVVI